MRAPGLKWGPPGAPGPAQPQAGHTWPGDTHSATPGPHSVLAHTVMVHAGEIRLPETKAEQINPIFLFATFKQQLNSYYPLFHHKQHKASPLPRWHTAPIYYGTRGNELKVKEERFRVDVRKKFFPQRWSGTGTDGPENHRIF